MLSIYVHTCRLRRWTGFHTPYEMQYSSPSSQTPILPACRDVLQTTKHRRIVWAVTSISLCNAQKEKSITLHAVLFTKGYVTQELKINK